MSEFEQLAKIADVPIGGAKSFPFQNTRVAIFEIGGQYYGIDSKCPHEGGPLATGEVVDHQVICPWHGAEFDVRSGKGISDIGQPCYVDSYEVRTEGEWLLVRRQS